MSEEPEVTVGFTPSEANIVKYAIRQHATGGESPAEKAQRLLKRLMPSMGFSFPMVTEETLNNPKSDDELRERFNHNRMTMNRSENQQVQLVMLALQAEMIHMDEGERLADVEDVVDSALKKLTDAADEIVEQMDDEEWDKEIEEAADEMVEGIADMDSDGEGEA